MTFTVQQAAALYAVELYEYPSHHPTMGARHGTLVASGTGLMMAMMDQLPIANCVDFDTAKNNPRCRIADFMATVAGHAPPLFVAGWFTSTRPEPMQAGCRLVRELELQENMACYSGGGVEIIDDAQAECLHTFFANSVALIAAQPNKMRLQHATLHHLRATTVERHAHELHGQT